MNFNEQIIDKYKDDNIHGYILGYFNSENGIRINHHNNEKYILMKIVYFNLELPYPIHNGQVYISLRKISDNEEDVDENYFNNKLIIVDLFKLYKEEDHYNCICNNAYVIENKWNFSKISSIFITDNNFKNNILNDNNELDSNKSNEFLNNSYYLEDTNGQVDLLSSKLILKSVNEYSYIFCDISLNIINNSSKKNQNFNPFNDSKYIKVSNSELRQNYSQIEDKYYLSNIYLDNTINSLNVDESIVNSFFKTLNEYQLHFKLSDIINLHTSIKSNLLTIISGLSGMGKSKIITAYADALGIKNDSQFNMISVRPFWQDDADLLGFADTMNNMYHPGDSGLVNTLIEANQHPDKLYIIVFDEMNLARIEYYFSQFLSVMEKAPQDRYIRLYDKSLKSKLNDSEQIDYKIKLPSNIRFVGTINVDESTFTISDKVLDRSNIISLQRIPFQNDNNYYKYDGKNILNGSCSCDSYKLTIHNNYSFNKNELKFFDNLNQSISYYLPDVGISWRNLNSIGKFLSNVSHFESFYNKLGFNESSAFDYQIAQKIIPKIRGTREMLMPLIDYKNDDNENNINFILNRYNDLSDFRITKKALRNKLRELKVMGFAK